MPKRKLGEITPPRLDFDQHSTSIGTADPDPGMRIPRTIIEWSRASNSESKGEGWEYSNLDFYNCALSISIVGLNAEDLGTLIDFLADCKQRLESY